jgi:hypothetical protein
MVEHTAHNGMAVGSSPTEPIKINNIYNSMLNNRSALLSKKGETLDWLI